MSLEEVHVIGRCRLQAHLDKSLTQGGLHHVDGSQGRRCLVEELRLVERVGEDHLLAPLAQAVDEVVDGLGEGRPVVGGEGALTTARSGGVP